MLTNSYFIPLDGTCTFPTYLVGDWTSAERGSLSITTDSIYNYKVYIPSSDPNNPTIAYYNFTCLTKVNANRFTIRLFMFIVFLQPHSCLRKSIFYMRKCFHLHFYFKEVAVDCYYSFEKKINVRK